MSSFLYGDLTPAPFTANFLEELRDAVDFAGAIAEVDQIIATADSRREAKKQRADVEHARISALAQAMLEAADRAECGDVDSATSRLAGELARLVLERQAVADAAVRAQLQADMRAIEAEALAARGDYFPILQNYLLARDPYDAKQTRRIDLVVGAKKDQHRYGADLTGESDIGLDWAIELGIPPEGPWAAPKRVEKVAPDLSIVAPYLAGLIKKEVKSKRQNIARLWITKLVDDGSTLRAELREEIGGEDGFTIEVDLVMRAVGLVKKGAGGDASVGAFEVDPADVAALVDFATKLHELARVLPKKQLVSASFDGLPFDGTNTDAQAKLIDVVLRLVTKIAPLVREVAVRSRSEEELVLRRLLADGKREELFMAKARIREKIGGLDARHFELFALLNAALDSTPAAEEERRSQVDRSEVPPSVPPIVKRKSGSMAAVVVPPKEQPKSDPVLEVSESSLGDEEVEPPSSRTATLKESLKEALSAMKGDRLDEAFRSFMELFGSTAFAMSRHEDQRQALRMMFFGKTPNEPTDPMKGAYKATLPALQALVIEHREPADYEMLGMAYVGIGEPEKATEIFKKALEIERERSPGSDLCGALMRRVSQL